MGRKRKPTPLKHCAYCGTVLERKRYPNGDLECLLHFGRRKYCNQECMGKAFDAKPSKTEKWSTTHYHARKLLPTGRCEICGKSSAKDAHHRDGDHRNNSPENLQRVCRGCHTKLHRQRGSCAVCGLPVKGLGYCDKHYQRFKRWGDPLMVKENQFVEVRKDLEPIPQRGCKVKGCTNQHHAHGYCGMHWMRKQRARKK